MTNANLTAVVQSAGGNEITLKYKDGEQKIIVRPARRSSPSTAASAPR